ncbi:MAG: 1-deoxy-D-xylulose-5-phosphate synthase [Firmicutes bacterium]|nr:1-deoxy-D-xylulose-5-phosphate synthase [Bacillota bacterium]
MKYLLEDAGFPEALKAMDVKQLELLSYEIREYLLDTISKTGGHLASNLGVVELTLALHKVFDSPKDKIIFDVGHQSYVHKMLTGRKEDLKTIRMMDGLSGFPKRSESEHDMFDSGHSSTSISAAAGYAAARDLKGEDHAVIAVIGDGALTGGVAYEALNCVGHSESPMIVILNDNEMSIGKNVGGMSDHLKNLRTSTKYLDFKKKMKTTLKNIPKIGEELYTSVEHLRDSLKYAIVDGAIFEEMGFKYFGPIDGHNLHDLIEILTLVKTMDQPVLVHVVTKKGKGYRNAEQNPGKFHGISPFDITTGKVLKEATYPSYSKIFGTKMLDLAEKDPRVVSISAAMVEATGLEAMSKKYPKRTFDVGIAEQHAVSFAAGLALDGMKPVVAIYSTFLQRAFDEILIDVCMQNLPVIFAIDRAGNVGNDGETHHGHFDLSYLSLMPNMTVLAPKDGQELEDMMEYALTLNGPCAIRFPRGEAEPVEIEPDYSRSLAFKEPQILRSGNDVAILACGKMTLEALKAAQVLEERGIQAAVINARFVKPLNEEIYTLWLSDGIPVVTVEDNTEVGGYGSLVNDILTKNGMNNPFLKIAWPDEFVRHGSTAQLMKKYKIDAQGIAERVEDFLGKR